MKEIKLKRYRDYEEKDCERCGEEREIHVTTDGGYPLCDLCVRKMTFDRNHPND